MARTIVPKNPQNHTSCKAVPKPPVNEQENAIQLGRNIANDLEKVSEGFRDLYAQSLVYENHDDIWNPTSEFFTTMQGLNNQLDLSRQSLLECLAKLEKGVANES